MFDQYSGFIDASLKGSATADFLPFALDCDSVTAPPTVPGHLFSAENRQCSRPGPRRGFRGNAMRCQSRNRAFRSNSPPCSKVGLPSPAILGLGVSVRSDITESTHHYVTEYLCLSPTSVKLGNMLPTLRKWQKAHTGNQQLPQNSRNIPFKEKQGFLTGICPGSSLGLLIKSQCIAIG